MVGVTLLFTEPPDARKPEIRWRLYVFKGGEVLNGRVGLTISLFYYIKSNIGFYVSFYLKNKNEKQSLCMCIVKPAIYLGEKEG